MTIKSRCTCKEYYWGFCKKSKADKDGNRDYCEQEKCDEFKVKKVGCEVMK